MKDVICTYLRRRSGAVFALAFALAFAFMLALALAACGGETPPPKTADAPADDTQAEKPKARSGNMPSVSQELGEIDPKEAERAMAKVQPLISACQKQGAARLDYIAGEVHVFVRLSQEGQVKWSYLESSTLGDRATEKCILDALAHAPWPKPRGGDAEVRKPFAFDAGDAREPAAWSPDRVGDAIAKAQPDVDTCKSGVKGNFGVTAYVVPDGKVGKVEAAGAAPPNKDADAKVDCILDVVKSMKLPSPGSYAAKVSFSL